MLDRTVTHYAPWDGTDAGWDDDRAVCGHWMTAADVHSLIPTCALCNEAIAAQDAFEARIELLNAVPLDAEEARTELDPVLNAGAPTADLFAYAVSLTRAYAPAVRRIA